MLIIGSPMGAAGFVTLAGHFTDRTVITYDLRGADRSTKHDPASESTPDEHADDLHRLIQALGVGWVDLFASSGGAVNALALVAKHPEDVITLVAHEPPAATVLPDADMAIAACRDIQETYQRRGFGPAMAKFIGLVSAEGPLPADYLASPAPDPEMFGLRPRTTEHAPMAETEDTHPRRTGRRPHLRRPQQRRNIPDTVAHHRFANGCRRVRDPGGPLHRPHGDHL